MFGLMKDYQHKVIARRNLTESVFVLRLERRGLDFRPGQFINVGLPGASHRREYSVYSPLQADYLEILVKEVEDGHLTPQLQTLRVGDMVTVRGPGGEFLLNEEDIKYRSYTFIATGTGISPFHCFVGSYPELDYRILHGVRTTDEQYERQDYPAERYTGCMSQDSTGDFHGRVTSYLQSHRPKRNSLFYLCGNADMIFEVFDILHRQGVNREQVFTEVYF